MTRNETLDEVLAVLSNLLTEWETSSEYYETASAAVAAMHEARARIAAMKRAEETRFSYRCSTCKEPMAPYGSGYLQCCECEIGGPEPCGEDSALDTARSECEAWHARADAHLDAANRMAAERNAAQAQVRKLCEASELAGRELERADEMCLTIPWVPLIDAVRELADLVARIRKGE